MILVETTGVEPVVPFGRRIYSPLGLPIFLHLHLKHVKRDLVQVQRRRHATKRDLTHFKYLEELRGIEPRLQG